MFYVIRVACLFFFARKLDKPNMNTEKLEDYNDWNVELHVLVSGGMHKLQQLKMDFKYGIYPNNW